MKLSVHNKLYLPGVGDDEIRQLVKKQVARDLSKYISENVAEISIDENESKETFVNASMYVMHPDTFDNVAQKLSHLKNYLMENKQEGHAKQVEEIFDLISKS